MARMTVDFGIDLGTTNSTVAVSKGMDVEVFKNNENAEHTPSTVWIDRNQALIVGRRAKERQEDDPANAFCEFKLQMGTDRTYTFARNGWHLTPAVVCAEVLQFLKVD